MLKIKTHYNNSEFKKNPEKFTLPSMTIPNMAMTPRELIIRFASGLPLEGSKTPIYEGEMDLPDIDKMDIIERDEYYQELKRQRQEVEDRVKDSRTKAEKAKMEKIIAERVELRKQEIERDEFEAWKKMKGGDQ